MSLNITEKLLPHFGERAAGKKVLYLILHITERASAREWWSAALAEKVSAHYCVDTDGSALRAVDEDKRAWHAGVSYWRGETDINSCSVGIEVQNPGGAAFPSGQIDGLVALCRDIISRHGIPPQNVLGHSDVAPGRKTDPGELFPWKELAARGVGLWPDILPEDRQPGQPKQLLEAYGYNPLLDEKVLLTEFQRRFQPHLFPDKAGAADPDSVHLMHSLLRLGK
jgi:N-acetylmuramoyl-L-alanine amidase